MTENKIEKKNENKTLLYINTIELLYRVADAGCLEKIVDVTFHQGNRKYKTFVFNNDPTIQRIINEYSDEKLKEKADKEAKLNAPAEAEKVKTECIAKAEPLKPIKTEFSLSNADKKAIIDGVVSQLRTIK